MGYEIKSLLLELCSGIHKSVFDLQFDSYRITFIGGDIKMSEECKIPDLGGIKDICQKMDIYIEKLYESISDEIEGGTYLVTGATGNIAKYIILLLLKKSNVKVLAVCHNKMKGESLFAKFIDNPNLEIIEHDISKKWKFKTQIDFIIHAAGICNNDVCRTNPIQVLNINTIGTNNILELAAELKVKKFLFFSSAAVYGTPIDNNIGILKENSIGFLDFSNLANIYAVSKRSCEALCLAYGNQYNLPVIIVRPFHIIEPMMMLEKSSMLGGFYESLLQNGEIVIKTGGTQKRNFIWIMNLIEIIFLLFRRGRAGEIYNIGNPNGTTSVFEMAHLIKKQMIAYCGMSDVRVIVKHENSKKSSNMVDMVPDLLNIMPICKEYNVNFMNLEQAIATNMHLIEKQFPDVGK